MSFSLSARKLMVCWCSMVAIPVAVFSQNSFVPTGGESALTGNLPGDQVHPSVNFTTNGGYVVWEDYFIDGKGLGIGGMRLKSDLSGSGVPFRVNSQTQNDQEDGQVSMLNNGGAVFTWQGGARGKQHVFARFLSPGNAWATADVMVNSLTNKYQITPVVATLLNGNVAVAYVSANQAGPGSMSDVYLQMFGPDGSKIGNEVQVNQFIANNQRTPAIAALASGNVAIAWVSEQQRWTDANMGVPSVDVYARIYDSTGNAVGSEFLVNVSSNVCAAPDLAASPDGGFLATWMERDLVVRNNGWDIFARRFSSSWVGGDETRVNTQLFGDQSLPKIRRSGSTYLDIWTSLNQDGSREGVFGRYLNDDASVSGNEFQVNSTTFGSQMHQVLGSDGAGRFLAAWTGFDPGPFGFNLYGQRYVDTNGVVIGANNPAFNTDPNANPNSVSNVTIVTLNVVTNEQNQTLDNNITNTFADVKGTYNGLIYDPSNVTAGNSGYITITTTTSKTGQGGFSAKLQFGGKKYSFSGPFDTSGAYSNNNVGGLKITLQIDLHGGDRITGAIAGGNWTALLVANRLVFSKIHTTPLAGTYTMVIQPIDDSMGSGVGTATVDTLGNVKWTATLADGTKVSASTTLSKDGQWALYSQPYKNGGVTVGWVAFGAKSSDGFEGKCAWTKPGGSAVFPTGLTAGVDVIGSLFKAPPVAFHNFGRSQVILSGGGLSSPITNTATWGIDNKIISSSSMKLSLSPTSGTFQGTVTTGSGKGNTVPFQGVLFERDNVGLGFFVGSGQSGTVTFAPNN